MIDTFKFKVIKITVITIFKTTTYYRIYVSNEWVINFYNLLQHVVRFHAFVGHKFIEIKSPF